MLPSPHRKNLPSLLIFYPQNPFARRQGSHLRCLQQLEDIKGHYNIIFASTATTSDLPWPTNRNDLQHLARLHGIQYIAIFEQSFLGIVYKILATLLKPCQQRRLTSVVSGKLNSLIFHALLFFWFNYLAAKHKSRALIIHYVCWSFLSRGILGTLKTLELHDILPITHYLMNTIYQILEKDRFHLSRYDASHIGYIENIQQLPKDIVTEVKKVVACLNRFDLVWMISSREDCLLKQLGLRIPSRVIYPVVAAGSAPQLKTLPPILPIGPNPFNYFSLYKFMQDVLPLLDDELSSRIEIQVTGSFFDAWIQDLIPPLKFYGYVDNYPQRLARSCFMIVPTAVGTGQQIKIFEALAMGTPVLTYKSTVSENICLEYPSIIAVKSPAEFAVTLSRLLVDNQLLKNYQQLALAAASRQADVRLQSPYSDSLQEALAVR